MGQALRILQWNIQNFGPLKGGLKAAGLTTGIRDAIALIVSKIDPDLFVMLELNTTDEGTASDVAQGMLDAFADLKSASPQWETCVLSPNTGKEFYAFFVKNTKTLVPARIVGPGNPPPSILGANSPIAKAQFCLDASKGVQKTPFPLLSPDLPANVRDRHAAHWPGTRLPVFGLFSVPAVSKFLPLIACHFAPQATVAQRQLDSLPYFSAIAQPGPLQVSDGKNTVSVTPPLWMVLGDFNLDRTAKQAYATLVDKLGCRLWNGDPTLLMAPGAAKKFLHDPNRIPGPPTFGVTCIDNFATQYEAEKNVLSDIGATVFDVVQLVAKQSDLGLRSSTKLLSEAATYYGQLDQRGLDGSNAYLDGVQDFLNQLSNPGSYNPNPLGALIGARIISDHLPVGAQFVLA